MKCHPNEWRFLLLHTFCVVFCVFMARPKQLLFSALSVRCSFFLSFGVQKPPTNTFLLTLNVKDVKVCLATLNSEFGPIPFFFQTKAA